MKNQDLLLEVAEKLFRKYGIKKVTVEEICTEAGISKMTFYRAFSSKNDIAGQVISQLSEQGINKYHDIMNANEPFSERIRKFVEMKNTELETFSEELLKDIYESDNEELKAIIEKHRIHSLNLFVADLKNAQKEGLIRKGFKPEFVISMLNTINQKVADPDLIALFKDRKEMYREVINFFFYGILTEEKL